MFSNINSSVNLTASAPDFDDHVNENLITKNCIVGKVA